MTAFQLKKDKNNSQHLFLDELDIFAKSFVKKLRAGDVVALSGTLGAGKTTFVNAVARQLGIPDDAAFSSPTFTIMNRYDTDSHTVYHVDLYRLKNFAELEDLDILNYFGTPDSVTFIEWADKFPELGTLFTKRVHFEYVKKEALERLISYDGFEM